MKKYSVFMNCMRMSNQYDTFDEAKEYLVNKTREYEKEGYKITYGIHSFATGELIYEIIEEVE